MPGFLGASSGGGGGTGGEIFFPKEFIDPVTKLRVSNPENLIDTDFEYGLQPTKWETVELINNTPSFFSKSGDTTIDGIVSMTTNAGTREITVETALDHNLAVGIPINVTGSKSLTADGSFIIASIPNSTTFTYLCKSTQTETVSINDLYTSIITGEFFQGSQIGIDDSEGIITDGASTSTLTVKTRSTHGFGEKTPLYLLNINSTISQDFQSANTASLSFDASNSATAQSFDGSNTLSTINIDWSNSGVEASQTSTISSVSTTNNTITVTHGAENFSELTLGTPLYYDVQSGTGFFNQNPRGVVFLKSTDGLGSSTSEFTVSELPDGDVISIEASISGTFQVSDLSRTFAGNNINPATQTQINIVRDSAVVFDGGNQGYDGAVQGSPPDNTSTIVGFTSDAITVTGDAALDYYEGAMIFYSTTGSAASGLTNNTTYFVKTFSSTGTAGIFSLTISDLPGSEEQTLSGLSGGTGTQTFEKIGVSLDKDIVHVRDANFAQGDMLEYTYPAAGNFGADTEKNFYFVAVAYDTRNFKLNPESYAPVSATGGTVLPDIEVDGRTYKVHQFTETGTDTFTVTSSGTEGGEIEYLIVAGGGGGGASMTVCTSNHWTSGGGGAGGVLMGSFNAEDSTNYTITVGEGGLGAVNNIDHFGFKGENSSIIGGSTSLIALGGGGGETRGATAACGQNMTGAAGGSGGGKSDWNPSPGGLGTTGQGNNGGEGSSSYTGGGGGGAGGPGINGQRNWAGDGGPGIVSYIRGTEEWFAGGGGGGGRPGQSITRSNGGIGGGGDGNNTSTGGSRTYGVNAISNTGGGGGGSGDDSNNDGDRGRAGNGGSGIVIVRYPITAPTVTPTIQASGGDRVDIVTISGQSYRVHQFSNLNTSIAEKDFVVTNAPAGATVDVLVVAGGGAGGFGYGDQDTGKGGGGAGGVVWEESVSVSAQSYSISVGKGGRKRQHGNNYTPQGPDNGGNTTAFGFTALGGGGGGQGDNYNTGARSGGSGGGAGARNSVSSSNLGRAATQPGSSSGGLGSSGGNSGGNGNFGGGGGGGASAPGQTGQSIGNNSIGGNGGVGIDLSSYFGTSYGDNGYFAGGGGGGGYSTSNLRPQSVGGLGGGGKGTSAKEHSTGHQWATGDIDGQPTTGGGGGGSSEDAGRSPMRGSASGGGGSGTVLIRYPVSI